MSKTTFISETALKLAARSPEGSYTEIAGERFYRIANYDAMPPFFMSLVSDSDHWLFISSNGALTAGRKDPDHALFPYYTDDRIHDSQDQTGSKTILRVTRGGKMFLWEPFSERYQGVYRVERNMAKSVYGNKIVFEEINRDLDVSFRYTWMSSERFGFVRRSEIANFGAEAVTIDIMDGIQNVLPSGLTRRFQLEYSTLADGYKRTELESKTGLALFRLSSIPIDKAEPSESLRVNVAWSIGLDTPTHLLSATQLEGFRQGKTVGEETDLRGRRGAYLLNTKINLAANAGKDWYIIAELDQDAAGVRALLKTLGSSTNLRAEIEEDVERGTQNLLQIVASADGLQLTGDELNSWRHYSNTLFNVMRGGIPDNGYLVSRDDFRLFLGKANTDVALEHDEFLAALPEHIEHRELLARAAAKGDVDLERLANEYLPLTFSRRHGDPSRPWNIFGIEIKGAHGEKVLNYQGNWRDIFQNWEALALSFPSYIESMIFKFLDSSTADGYNPYRLMRDGYEWEVIDPHDPWSFIGYWGDHQVIYLLKLLEESRRYHPEMAGQLLTREIFTYANIPYRIKPYAALIETPRATITFDAGAHDATMRRERVLGSDGKALTRPDGSLCHANLAEKLLVVALSKLSNYIPEAGIWMNTQRPEWNDANNALVGSGVSMVTLYYLRRYLHFARELFAGDGSIEIASEVSAMLAQIAAALSEKTALLTGAISDKDRRALVDALGRAGEHYRAKLYDAGLSGRRDSVSRAQLQQFCDIALMHIDHSIRANRRPDGLYHSYNLIKFTRDGVEVRHLYEMLEGQVAALSSGALSNADAITLLDALRQSELYRKDQQSYILYPDRPLPHFLEKNNIPAVTVAKSKLLTEMLAAGDRRIVVRDVDGGVHFNSDFRNSGMLDHALAELRSNSAYELNEHEEALVLGIYEQVFDHQSFTGRSGTFYKYEGLGSIYWHMVSKLLLAIGEVLEHEANNGADAPTIASLKRHYHEVREGIGVHKTPVSYGAIPTDPYSHTPGFAGVQQPGMTGQVKEDFITRFGEMGVDVKDGRLEFIPTLVTRSEFLSAPATFHYIDLTGKTLSLALAPNTMAFTVCQVPVVAHRDGAPHIEVTLADGSKRSIDSLRLDEGISAGIFGRNGAVIRVDVFYALGA